MNNSNKNKAYYKNIQRKYNLNSLMKKMFFNITNIILNKIQIDIILVVNICPIYYK